MSKKDASDAISGLQAEPGPVDGRGKAIEALERRRGGHDAVVAHQKERELGWGRVREAWPGPEGAEIGYPGGHFEPMKSPRP